MYYTEQHMSYSFVTNEAADAMDDVEARIQRSLVRHPHIARATVLNSQRVFDDIARVQRIVRAEHRPFTSQIASLGNLVTSIANRTTLLARANRGIADVSVQHRLRRTDAAVAELMTGKLFFNTFSVKQIGAESLNITPAQAPDGDPLTLEQAVLSLETYDAAANVLNSLRTDGGRGPYQSGIYHRDR